MATLSIRRIPDFPTYAISRCGQVFNLAGRNFKKRRRPDGYIELTQCMDGNYLCVALKHSDGLFKKFGVHRLVLLTYVGPPPEGKPWACHVNDNPKDNRLENLYWGDGGDNARDRITNGGMLRGESHGNSVLTEAAVFEMKKLYHLGGVTVKQLADKFNTHFTNVTLIVSGKTWQHVAPEYTVKPRKMEDARLLPGEELRPCRGYPGKFVTNKRRVFTQRGRNMKVLKTNEDRPAFGDYVTIDKKLIKVYDLYLDAFGV